MWRPIIPSCLSAAWRVLPADQPHRRGRRTALADLRDVDGPRGRVPLPEIRTRPQAYPPPRAQTHRRPSVHRRRRLSTLPDRSTTPARPRPRRQLDRPAQPPRHAMPRHRHVPLRRRARTLHLRKATAPNRINNPSTSPTASIPTPAAASKWSSESGRTPRKTPNVVPYGTKYARKLLITLTLYFALVNLG